MMNAGAFKPKQKTKRKEFELILEAIAKSHQMMLADYDGMENDENRIRNRLWKDYLNDNQKRQELGIVNYIFKTENPEIGDDYRETGRHDIQIMLPTEYTRNTDAYFVIECKRLEHTNTGRGSLNQKYVDEGIKRFVERRDYPTYYGLNGMLGFLVKSAIVTEVVAAINSLLVASEQLHRYIFNSINENSYRSNHRDHSNQEVQLYHLILDFSTLIVQ